MFEKLLIYTQWTLDNIKSDLTKNQEALEIEINKSEEIYSQMTYIERFVALLTSPFFESENDKKIKELQRHIVFLKKLETQKQFELNNLKDYIERYSNA